LHCGVYSELNDDASGGMIDDDDGPVLLKTILAHDPQALQLSAYHLTSAAGNSSG